jgi:serine/threonine protein kinase
MVPNPNNASEMIPALIQEAVGEADLAAVINGPVLNPFGAVQLGLQVIAGVNALGEGGIVHGDLKPGNMRIGVDGVHIIDLGGSAPEGYREAAFGTCFYMAPEVFVAIYNNQDINGSASQDLYSMGIILMQVLFGNLFQINQINQLTHLLGLDTLILRPLGEIQSYVNLFNFRMVNQIMPENLFQAFQEVNKGLTDPYPNDVLKEMAVIMAACLQVDPSKRPTATEVYERWTQVYIKMTDPRINPNAEWQQQNAF